MDDWLEKLAAAVGVEPLTREETAGVLKLARDVAHGVERKFAPLSTYLLGVAVGRETASGRSDAFRRSMGAAGPLVPPPAADIGAREDLLGG
jgi:hypothetical protein